MLLDAGAGNVWTFEEAETGWQGGRSEGLAVASYAMFVKGFFSSDPQRPYQVDGGWDTVVWNSAQKLIRIADCKAKRFSTSSLKLWPRSFR